MNAADVIALAGVHGVTLTASGEYISAAPTAKLTPELTDGIRRHRADILKVLNNAIRPARADQDIKPDQHTTAGQGRISNGRARQPLHRRNETSATQEKSGDIGSTKERLTDPDGPCETCGSGQYWQVPGEPWHCWQCEPNAPLAATTLTLTCHPPPAPSDSAQTVPDSVFATACEGLSITPARLREQLSDDLDANASGELTAPGLRLTAEALADSLPPQNEAIDMLRQDPELECAFVTSGDDPKFVYVDVALRGQATGKLRIPRDRYDSLKALAWIEQHASKAKP
ncbi:MAG TPA: hypothetical protein VKB96_08435 [Gammaproteobacteria bacterium]|nr:hypothetical protein [Gammaproteobacteria bacterium]